MQVMAVAAGGDLEQHVPDRVGHDDHSPAVGGLRHAPGEHRRRDPAGRPARRRRRTVPTYHHQSVLTHPGFEPSAWADDGTLEAMEDPAARFRLGVQWHPEVGDDPRLFDALVEAAARRTASAALTTMADLGFNRVDTTCHSDPVTVLAHGYHHGDYRLARRDSLVAQTSHTRGVFSLCRPVSDATWATASTPPPGRGRDTGENDHQDLHDCVTTEDETEPMRTPR